MNRTVLPVAEQTIAPAADRPLSQLPVFIVGAPRSGSTLLMQVISQTLDVGYISNRHCRWYGAPGLVGRKSGGGEKGRPSDYRSMHGRTEGPDAPAECGEWWYRFFRRKPAYVTTNDVSRKQMGKFRRSIALLADTMKKPLIFKNLYASLRMLPIAKFVPESLFIVISRNLAANARSILEARFSRTGDYGNWFSVPPPDVERLMQLAPVPQVVGQIRSIYQTIEADLHSSNVEESRVLRVRYEDLCQSPDDVAQEIANFLQRHGAACRVRAACGRSFTPSAGAPLPPAEEAALADCLQQSEHHSPLS